MALAAREGGDLMLKIKNVETYGWEAAVRGMRNPKNSWDKSDSLHCCDEESNCGDCGYFHCPQGNPLVIGKNDMKLMTTLANAGTDHGKFMRMIIVTLDIVAPLYWWSEYDTYKVGTVANSCSKMHKIADKEFVESDFSTEHLFDFEDAGVEFPTIHGAEHTPIWALNMTIKMLNFYREKYLETKKKPMKEEAKRAPLMKKYWWQMIQLLPSSYNQRRTVQLNYAVLKNIYHARKDHKLDEWHTFCDWIERLPYSELITGKASE